MKKFLCALLVLALLAALVACSKSEGSSAEPVATVSTATPSLTPAAPSATPSAPAPAPEPPAPVIDPLREDYLDKLALSKDLENAIGSGNSSEELISDLEAAETALSEARSALEADRITRIHTLKISGTDYTFGPLFELLNGKLSYQISDEGVEEFSLDIKLGETYRSLSYDAQKALAVQIWDFVLNKTTWPFEDSSVDRSRLQSYDVTHAEPRAYLTLYFTLSEDLSSASFTASPTLFGRNSSQIDLGFDGRSFGYREYYTWFRALPTSSPEASIRDLLSLICAALPTD